MSRAVCTECHYIYDSKQGVEELGIVPGTPFEYVDDSFSCPHCESSKDQFVEVVEEVVEISDPEDMTEIESEHVPVYRMLEDELFVSIGAYGAEHSQEEGHFIEWIEVRDAAGEIIERTYFGPNDEPSAYFAIDLDEVGEVRASCIEHGIWKGIPHESLSV